MRRLFATVATLLAFLALHARASLGDTLEAAQERYGYAAGHRTLSADGLWQEVTYRHKHWKIRCLVARATDGKDYIVREEYTKEQSPHEGNASTIQGFERAAAFEMEASPVPWLARRERGGASSRPMAWTRGDGATARLSPDNVTLTLELPAARAWKMPPASADR